MTTSPFTLFSLAGREPAPPALGETTLILIDYQNEYLSGPLTLVDAEAAVGRAGVLLAAARQAGAKIIHVAHKGAAGGPFDRAAERGAFIDALKPLLTEAIVEKPRPNAFSGTSLADLVGPSGAKVVIAGFMTHNCVSSTARAALDLGYEITVAGDACATRDLPSPAGVVTARQLHIAELAGLADRHACVTDVATLTARKGDAA
ncbi:MULTISPECIES: cysteine hydrolase family protein [unclassified Sinorhizobium]|uniref:cysteine hydrolase family protein n=1 Tax=unclassified Sinorhizobium TaxID=2613772 RepID=UPI0024C3C772|nr:MULTISPECIES: cysteine hydrolase family protein [unclassified Sinorhizobium]MDK1378505.1 cysteine hydrolase family protein [Sinorhizobium sp. 6-70]MDK1480609.1 cysteine hydrolase family protein [Sinorhizobium sp. 6-117]